MTVENYKNVGEVRKQYHETFMDKYSRKGSSFIIALYSR